MAPVDSPYDFKHISTAWWVLTAVSIAIGSTGCGASSGGPGGDTGGAAETGRVAGMTAAHNAVRSAHGVGPLTWSPTVAGVAQSYADELASQGCNLNHSSNGYGENLAWNSGYESTAQQVVDLWAGEEKDYNYAANSCSGVCGHYTQVVWKDSTELGCGMAKCGAAEVWVCNYNPPGNYVGQKPY